jgi:hypothetical protein
MLTAFAVRQDTSASTTAKHPSPKPRHSGLDPESRPYPVMDPGSMSPRRLGDVRDDVCSVLLASVFTRYSGPDPESRNNHHSPPNRVIPSLTRNPLHIPFMDPGSMSPRRLGDVRDDVTWSLPSMLTAFAVRQDTSAWTRQLLSSFPAVGVRCTPGYTSVDARGVSIRFGQAQAIRKS